MRAFMKSTALLLLAATTAMPQQVLAQNVPNLPDLLVPYYSNQRILTTNSIEYEVTYYACQVLLSRHPVNGSTGINLRINPTVCTPRLYTRGMRCSRLVDPRLLIEPRNNPNFVQAAYNLISQGNDGNGYSIAYRDLERSAGCSSIPENPVVPPVVTTRPPIVTPPPPPSPPVKAVKIIVTDEGGLYEGVHVQVWECANQNDTACTKPLIAQRSFICDNLNVPGSTTVSPWAITRSGAAQKFPLGDKGLMKPDHPDFLYFKRTGEFDENGPTDAYMSRLNCTKAPQRPVRAAAAPTTPVKPVGGDAPPVWTPASNANPVGNLNGRSSSAYYVGTQNHRHVYSVNIERCEVAGGRNVNCRVVAGDQQAVRYICDRPIAANKVTAQGDTSRNNAIAGIYLEHGFDGNVGGNAGCRRL